MDDDLPSALAEWRAAERRLAALPLRSSDLEEAVLAVEEARRRYQRLAADVMGGEDEPDRQSEAVG